MTTDNENFEEIDVEVDVAAEAEVIREAKVIKASPLLDNPVVELGGRTFEIDEPNIGITLRIINVIGRIGVRGEKIASRLVQNPSSRAAVFGILAGLNVVDLYDFGSAVLQFEDEKEGRRFMKDLGPKGLKLAPLVKAFFLNYAQSDDLREALANFTMGQDLLEVTLREIV